jgi:hypothetical protein
MRDTKVSFVAWGVGQVLALIRSKEERVLYSPIGKDREGRMISDHVPDVGRTVCQVLASMDS